MTQQLEDLISPHSESLCQTFNEQYPDTIHGMARYFAKQDIASANVVEVRQDGFKIDGQNSQGRNFQVSVAFSEPVTSLKKVKDAFLLVGKKAEQGTPVLNRRQIPGQPPGLGVYWPHWSPFLTTLAISVSSFFYIYFFPDTTIPLLRWTKNKVGLDTVHSCVHFAVGLHSFQTVTALYLIKDVAKCPFSLKQTAIWSVCVQFLGIGSMLKLLPIVYNSKFVSDEIAAQEKLKQERQESPKSV